MQMGKDKASYILWKEAQQKCPELFSLDNADIVHPHSWTHAVPIIGKGHAKRIASYKMQAPIVFCGDWLVQPCIEGAVRSGEIAAKAFGYFSPDLISRL